MGMLLPNLQHHYSSWATRRIQVCYVSFSQFPRDRAFLYNAFYRTILLLFKRMLFCTQNSCKMFQKGCKLGEFFGQLLFLRVFITKFNVSPIWVSGWILSVPMDWDLVSMMKFTSSLGTPYDNFASYRKPWENICWIYSPFLVFYHKQL